MRLLQEKIHTHKLITVDGIHPKKSSERTMLECSRCYSTALAMNRTRNAATLKKIVMCVCMSCACLTRIKIVRLICSGLPGVALTLNDITVLLW